MNKVLFLLLAFFLQKANGQSLNFLQKISPQSVVAGTRFGVGMAADGNYLLVGAPDDDLPELQQNNLSNAGSVSIFEKDDSGTWVFVQKIFAENPYSDVWFGNQVSILGDYIAVGAYGYDYDLNGENFVNESGAVFIFKKGQDGVWTQYQKIVLPSRNNNDFFGGRVKLFDDSLIVTSIYEDSDENESNYIADTGSIYIYKLNEDEFWEQHQKIVASDRNQASSFGQSLDVFGDQMAVGSYAQNPTLPQSSGAVYVFKKNTAGFWIQEQKLIPSDIESNDNFGFQISITDNTLVIGSRNGKDSQGLNQLTNAGSCYIYIKNTNSIWNPSQKITAPIRGANDFFGTQILQDGNNIYVTAPNEDDDENENSTFLNSGSIYSYSKTSDTWDFVSKTKSSEPIANALFGISMVLVQQSLIIGAPYEMIDGQIQVGSVYAYQAGTLDTPNLQAIRFLVTPNPTNRDLYIRLDGANEASITVLDVAGRITDNHNISSEGKISIDGDKGIYFLKFLSNGKEETLKIIKY